MTNEIIPHEWSTKTSCTIFVEDMLLVNKYNFKIGFDTSSINPILHDIAFEKIQMFFDILLSNSIIISKEDFVDRKFIFKNNFIQLPSLLNDQTLGSVIFSKLMSIVGEDIIICYIKISSSLGKKICYTIDNESPELHALLPSKEDWWENTDIKNQPWWMRPDTATYDEVIKGDNIYIGEFDWNEHFESEIEEAKNLDGKKAKFEIIRGGKDET